MYRIQSISKTHLINLLRSQIEENSKTREASSEIYVPQYFKLKMMFNMQFLLPPIAWTNIFELFPDICTPASLSQKTKSLWHEILKQAPLDWTSKIFPENFCSMRNFTIFHVNFTAQNNKKQTFIINQNFNTYINMY